MKKRMKRIAAAAAAWMAVVCLMLICACNNTDTAAETDTDTDAVSQEQTAPETDAETTAETDTETVPETEAPTEPATEEETVALPEVKDTVLGQANVATGGYAMASSTKQYSNILVNDGKADTAFVSDYMNSADEEAYIFIDLTDTYTLRSVVLYPKKGSEAFFPSEFTVDISSDFKTWTTVAEMKGYDGVGDEGLTVELNGEKAVFVRIRPTKIPKDTKSGKYWYALSEIEVMADVDAVHNIVLAQNDIWLYADTSATLVLSDNRTGVTGNAVLTYGSTRPGICTVDSEGNITPTGFGDCEVFAFDGTNLAVCHVRVIDDSGTDFRISTFYHSSFGHPMVIPQALDYMKEMGFEFLEETRAYDAAGNRVCDYMMYLCAQRGIFYSVCDPVNSGAWLKLSDGEIIELVKKYENRAGFGGFYLVDEPTDDSNRYAHVVKVISDYNPHLTAHLNLLPQVGASWDQYIADAAAIIGDTHETRYLSYDNYGLMADGSFNEQLYSSLDGMRKTGLKYDVRTGYYIQAMGIKGIYRVSSASDVMFNAAIGVAYGMKNYKYFVYLAPYGTSEAFTTGILTTDFTLSSMAEGITAANARIKEVGKALGDSDAVEVYHSKLSGPSNKVPDNFPLIQSERKNYLIYTLYQPRNGGAQMVVITRTLHRGGKDNIVLKVDESITHLERLENGVWVDLPISEDHTVTLALDMGEFDVIRLPEGYDGRQPAETNENLAYDKAAWVSSSVYTFWQATKTSAVYLTDGTNDNGHAWQATADDTNPIVTVNVSDGAGNAQSVGRVEIFPATCLDLSLFPAVLDVQISADGQTWTTVTSYVELAASDGEPLTCSFTAAPARFVRLVMNQPGAALGEIQVYAK